MPDSRLPNAGLLITTRIVMEIPIVFRYELQSLISKYLDLNDKLCYQNRHIDSLQKFNYNNHYPYLQENQKFID